MSNDEETPETWNPAQYGWWLLEDTRPSNKTRLGKTEHLTIPVSGKHIRPESLSLGKNGVWLRRIAGHTHDPVVAANWVNPPAQPPEKDAP